MAVVPDSEILLQSLEVGSFVNEMSEHSALFSQGKYMRDHQSTHSPHLYQRWDFMPEVTHIVVVEHCEEEDGVWNLNQQQHQLFFV